MVTAAACAISRRCGGEMGSHPAAGDGAGAAHPRVQHPRLHFLPQTLLAWPPLLFVFSTEKRALVFGASAVLSFFGKLSKRKKEKKKRESKEEASFSPLSPLTLPFLTFLPSLSPLPLHYALLKQNLIPQERRGVQVSMLAQESEFRTRLVTAIVSTDARGDVHLQKLPRQRAVGVHQQPSIPRHGATIRCTTREAKHNP